MTETLRENLLLAALQPAARQLVVPELQPVYLRRQTLLTSGDSDVYFPLSCVISVISQTAEGQSVQNLVVGFDGALTTPGRSSLHAMVQIEGEALRLSRASFIRLQRDEDFREIIDLHREDTFALAGQASVCQAFHATEKRLAFWLAAIRDRSLTDELYLTQEYLASMLGVRRPTVTIAAGILQTAGLISYRYGRLTIVDHAGLRDAACDCYAATQASLNRFARH